SWPYDGEIDLGFGGALRMAATMLTRDPIFGWVAYGGEPTPPPHTPPPIPPHGRCPPVFLVCPATTTRRSTPPPLHHSITPSLRRLKLELDRDGFAAGQNIVADYGLRQVSFTVENRTSDEHSTALWLSLPAGSSFRVAQDGNPVPLTSTHN